MAISQWLTKGKSTGLTPDPRAILPIEDFHIPRSLQRTLKQQPFEIRIDDSFDRVIQSCAEPAPDRPTTWINAEIIESYNQLHQMGYAHSVEAWQDGRLVGGLYGVSIGGLFAGESMFSRVTDASKVCLVSLVQWMQAQNMSLLDVQYNTPHLGKFGVIEIPRSAYLNRLEEAINLDITSI